GEEGRGGEGGGAVKGGEEGGGGDVARPAPAERVAVPGDAATCRSQVTGDRIERGGLTGAVGTDETGDRAALHTKGNSGQRDHAAELHAEIRDVEHYSHESEPRRILNRRPGPRRILNGPTEPLRISGGPPAAGAVRRVVATMVGTMPRGRKNTHPTSTRPYASICHCHATASRSASGSTVNSSAPTTGPASVPWPPAITMITIVTV